MSEPDESSRREHVLKSALETFARYGYKKTSMEDVARAADISRPGLYFLFTSKQNLFRDAVTYALDGDVEAAERALADTERPLRDRLIEAFDLWTGRYVGSMAKEVAVLIETNPELLGPVVADYPKRFLEIVTAAVAAELPSRRASVAEDMARTLLSTAGGIKHEVNTRIDFVARMTVGVDLFLPALESASS
ncbi:TetR/AcrR family transcriptional regulator [Amycolatopsis sp.]|uniref:TetR/AcrR family transcriptional regulator n=1 Tax=Amycolatopsis sp. TaxID=37632 RepID=UPI002C20A280|nr:TetR/AcrR family transcriptional regulator [Amycolatopsis sp.]HVV12443.1 TetR/AcrR family transcriptional regulator [Amycolatopsis sp.]